MSSALSRSLDPVDVANLMAEHLARAAGRRPGADQRLGPRRRPGPDARVVPTRAARDARRLLPARGLPETLRVLEQGGISVIDTEDPAADAAEVAFLREVGMRGLVMLPLVAKGEAIGLVELASRAARRPTRARSRSCGRWPTRRRWPSRTPGCTRRRATSRTATRSPGSSTTGTSTSACPRRSCARSGPGGRCRS